MDLGLQNCFVCPPHMRRFASSLLQQTSPTNGADDDYSSAQVDISKRSIDAEMLFEAVRADEDVTHLAGVGDTDIIVDGWRVLRTSCQKCLRTF